MDLKDAVYRNWELWAQGGLDEQTVLATVAPKDKDMLLEWRLAAGSGYGSAEQPDLKRTLDLASWCVYGTHTLLYLPPEDRSRQLNDHARKFGVSQDELTGLILRSRVFESQPA